MKYVKRFVRKILNTGGSLYYRIRAYHPIWFYILNRKGRALYKAAGFSFSEEEKKAIHTLREKGIYITHISKFFPPEIFNELQGYVDRRWKDGDVEEWKRNRDTLMEGEKMKSKEYFLFNLWEGSHVINVQHPFIGFSLSNPIVKIVSGYLGALPRFRYFSLEATMPMSEGMRAYASQQWHRDPDDQQLVKAFLYLNDVDEAGGPFTYLQYSQRGGKWRTFFPQQPPRGNAKTTEDVNTSIPKEDVIQCMGKAGTMIFCDTSGLHKGGYASSNVRFMYTSAYLSNASPWPIRYTYPSGFDARKLSNPLNYVLDNDPHQKEPQFYLK